MSSLSRAKHVLYASSALAIGLAAPAFAQDSSRPSGQTTDAAGNSNDIVVTARRVEERLQDVPISITVLNQTQLNNNNVTSARDLAAVTPGLQINSRYGADASNFSVRGFTQEQRTYATVGTYFADVVAPRGSGGTFGGDGAGPGSLFDLQNVQVLKGPQGTLQGRNSTGGAVLLVPQKPTSRFEGYAEGSYGNYDMKRGQAVINIPINDTFRVRFGIDREKRDGYLKNIGLLGDGRYDGRNMGDVDYIAIRGSAVAELTPNLENYFIGSYTESHNNGVIPKVTACYPGVTTVTANGVVPFGAACAAQLAREAGRSPWTVENRLPNSQSRINQFQLIDTITWQASDSLTIKNNIAYGEFLSQTNLDLYGNYFAVNYNPAGTFAYNGTATSRFSLRPGNTVTSGNQVTGFAFTSANPFNNHTNAQSSFVEEVQIQGHPSSGKFVYQGGLYAEINDPLGPSGVQTATFAGCADIRTYNCAFGSPNFSLSKSKFRDYAVYGQASYNITDTLKLTAGGRYTWDKQYANIQIETVSLATLTTLCTNASVFGTPTAPRTFPVAQRYQVCGQNLKQNTSAPTWLIDLDYKPIEDILIYGKYARGYRQGGLSLFSPDTTQSFKKETVDSFEGGAKTSWHGSIPGSFNLAVFYNKFTDQQLLVGVTSSTGLAPSSASVVNAGKSYLEGAEAELNLRPFQGFQIDVSYAYLKTKLQKFVVPPFPAGSLYDTVTAPLVGGSIPNSIPHKVNVAANYTLPLPESVGRITVGGTFIYVSRYRSVVASCPFTTSAGCNSVVTPAYSTVGFIQANGGVAFPDEGKVPGYKVVNLNATWANVVGLPIDASVYATNVFNKVYYLNVNANASRGFDSSILGEPRMYGVRLRYRFGG